MIPGERCRWCGQVIRWCAPIPLVHKGYWFHARSQWVWCRWGATMQATPRAILTS